MVNAVSATPKWLAVARDLIGTKEIPGVRHSNIIQGWLRKLGAWWSDDETPWCGVFLAYCMQKAGLPFPKAYYRASAWADYGSRLRTDRLAPGAILVFQRAGGGHVGFYLGEDKTHYIVLGGNQSNAVSIAKIRKDRLIASRWPNGEPVIGKPVAMTFGGKETTNEA